METPMLKNTSENILAVLEARLEGYSISHICELTGLSQNYIRKVLKEEQIQIKLAENQALLEENLQDIRHRDAQMKEKSTEIILDALNEKMGVDKKFDAAKIVYKTQKFESVSRDATAAFRGIFTQDKPTKTGD